MISWWRHQTETFTALLVICAGNSPVPGEFPAQRPVTRSFDVFFDLHQNKRLSKQSWGWWFETLWRHCNVSRVMVHFIKGYSLHLSVMISFRTLKLSLFGIFRTINNMPADSLFSCVPRTSAVIPVFLKSTFYLSNALKCRHTIKCISLTHSSLADASNSKISILTDNFRQFISRIFCYIKLGWILIISCQRWLR